MSVVAGLVQRSRLGALLDGAALVLLEAGLGFDKTDVAHGLAEEPGATAVWVRPVGRDGSAAALLRSTHRALAAAGLPEAAEVVAATAADPDGLADAVHDGLLESAATAVLVVDDVHQLQPSAVAVLAALLDELPAPNRAVVAGRLLPAPLRRGTHRAGAVVLGASDLALTPAEIAEQAAAHGLSLPGRDVDAIGEATAGWPAAVRRVLGRLRQPGAGGPTPAVAAAAAVSALIDELLALLSTPARQAAAQLAHLPLLDGALAEHALGDAGLYRELLLAGLPVVEAGDGWWSLLRPARERAAALAPLNLDVAAVAAALYDRRGERASALRTLLAAGAGASAVRLAAGWTSQVACGVGVQPLAEVVRAVDEATLAAEPRVLVHLSRSHARAGETQQQADVLHLAAGLATHPRARREIQAEQLLADTRRAAADELAERARTLHEEAEPDEVVVRTKALQALAYAQTGGGDAAALRHADRHLDEALDTWDRLGEIELRADAALLRGVGVAWALGRQETALVWIDRCLAAAGSADVQRAAALAWRAMVLVDVGRLDEAAADLDEAAELSRRVPDLALRGHVARGRARLSAARGDGDATEQALQRASDALADRPGPAHELAADGALLLSAVGRHERALAWLHRVECDDSTSPAVALAAFAVHARGGDAHAAARLLQQARAAAAVPPRDEWRVALLAAEAARRRGDDPGTAVEDAVRLAAATDVPDAPWRVERALIDALRPAAASPVPASPEPTTVQLLGRFAVHRGSTDLTPPPGRLAELVKVVAVHGGRASVERVITELWPDASADTGRERLRRVLARLRRACGDLVTRDGDGLCLPDDVTIDHREFLAQARDALAASGSAAAEAARRAVQHPAELLPEDTAEEWAQQPRGEVTRLRLAVLDRLADVAGHAGDDDTAVSALEDALDLDPLDEARAERLADLLDAVGRTGRAQQLRAWPRAR